MREIDNQTKNINYKNFVYLFVIRVRGLCERGKQISKRITWKLGIRIVYKVSPWISY